MLTVKRADLQTDKGNTGNCVFFPLSLSSFHPALMNSPVWLLIFPPLSPVEAAETTVLPLQLISVNREAGWGGVGGKNQGSSSIEAEVTFVR